MKVQLSLHDRYFINQLANKVFDLNHDGVRYILVIINIILKTEQAAIKAHENIQRADNKLRKPYTTIIIQIILIKRTQTSSNVK